MFCAAYRRLVLPVIRIGKDRQAALGRSENRSPISIVTETEKKPAKRREVFGEWNEGVADYFRIGALTCAEP